MLRALKIEGHYRARRKEVKKYILLCKIVQKQLTFHGLDEVIMTHKSEVFDLSEDAEKIMRLEKSAVC